MLGAPERALLVLQLVVLMAGMGASLHVDAFRKVWRAPRGVLIGLASQFGWMPWIAFALATLLELPRESALGLILVGCTPGGTTSNLFTYYSRADLALSISMTVTSTLVAVVAMPLLLWRYATPLTGASMEIPYGSIVATLALVLVPLAAGMAVRVHRPTLARRMERAGSLSGLGVLALLVGAGLWRNGHELFSATRGELLASMSLGALGMLLGYAAARLARLQAGAARAVALETGLQNSTLAFAIILSSFPESMHTPLLRMPLAYALFVLLTAIFTTLWFRAQDARDTQSAEAPAATNH